MKPAYRDKLKLSQSRRVHASSCCHNEPCETFSDTAQCLNTSLARLCKPSFRSAPGPSCSQLQAVFVETREQGSPEGQGGSC